MTNHTSKLASIITMLLLSVVLCVTTTTAQDKLVGKTVNINTASVEELAQVPLISPELAEAIVEYREEAGDFQVLEELLQVEGFNRKLLRRIKDFLLLEGLGGDECTC